MSVCHAEVLMNRGDCITLFRDMGRQPIEFEEIRPVHVPETYWTMVGGPRPCKVINPQTEKGWSARGRSIKAEVGPVPGLHYWNLTGSMSGRRALIFGYQSGGWKYATVVPRSNRVMFQPHDTQPGDVNIDNHEELSDMRAFYLVEDSMSSGEGAHLVPAHNENMAVIIDGRRDILRVAEKGPSTDKWRIDS